MKLDSLNNFVSGRFRCVVAGLLVAAIPLQIRAEGLVLNDQDAFATARGGAVVATADNPSAIYYNPAGIAQLDGQQFRAGTYAFTSQTDFHSPGGMDIHSQRSFDILGYGYYTFAPTNLPLAFGLGFYSPFGLDVEWPENTGFRSVALEANIRYYTLQPVVAWRVLDSLSLGIGPTFNYATADLKQGLSPVPGNDYFQLQGNDFAVGFTAGLRWQPADWLAFGATYRSATTMDIHGHSEIYSVAPPIDVQQDAAANLDFPQRATAGVSWRPTHDWNVEFDATWTGWSSFGTIPIQQATPVPPLVLDAQDSWSFAWGVTRYFGDGWRASGGYVYSESLIPEQHFNPLFPDMDRHVFSVGIGRTAGRWSWDMAYQLTWGAPRTVSGSAVTAAGQSSEGRYELMNQALTVSVGLSF
jgi:long-chain fatty acid transport protein